MVHRPDNSNVTGLVANPGRLWLFGLGGAAGLILSALFLIGAVDILFAATNAAGANGPLAPLQDNWLVILFKVNLHSSVVTPGALTVLNPLDICIMVLFAAFSFSLSLALRQTSRAWSLIAASLPILGIPVFLATGTAGRSALLISALILSIVMLRSTIFNRSSAYIGIASSMLLFIGGDIATAIFHSADTIASLLAIGYVLWVIWLLLIALKLLQFGRIRLGKYNG